MIHLRHKKRTTKVDKKEKAKLLASLHELHPWLREAYEELI
ncbi:MAG TPA: hypothetical protein VIK26_07820 [Clostridium sp.]